mgnify:CR=1 FL=1
MLSAFPFSSEGRRVDTERIVFPLVEARQISDPSVTVQYSGLMMTQNSEEIVVMTAALEQGITLQGEPNIDMSHPPRSPIAHYRHTIFDRP